MIAKVLKRKREPFNWGMFKIKAAPYIFISPFYICFLAFGTFPILYAAFLSLQSWGGYGPFHYVGLQNYIDILTDELFWKSLVNTLVMWAICLLPLNILALFFAFVLNSTLVKFKGLFKAIYFLPYLTSTVAVAMVFGLMAGYKFGILNYLIELFSKTGLYSFTNHIEFLKGPLAWLTISSVSIWKWTGWSCILYFAALQGISPTLYEAARVDGATWPQIFWSISLPLLRPIIYFNITMSVINGMQMFDEPMVFFGTSNVANVDNIGLTSSMYLYRCAFMETSHGYAAALSYMLFLVIFIMWRIVEFIFKEK